jgi:hypothetical protein
MGLIMASRLDKARRRKFVVLMRRGLTAKDAAIQAGYSESTARTHVYSWPEVAEARAEILQALDGEGVDQTFLAKHLKRKIIKGDVRAMALAGRWRGYERAWSLEPGAPREVFSEREAEERRRERICLILGLEAYPLPPEREVTAPLRLPDGSGQDDSEPGPHLLSQRNPAS